MAACCEVLAFGLGALTSMPAVRNFSICAAIAVGLDFLLQVSAMWSYMEEGGGQLCASVAVCEAILVVLDFLLLLCAIATVLLHFHEGLQRECWALYRGALE
jgi:hypothetical protein